MYKIKKQKVMYFFIFLIFIIPDYIKRNESVLYISLITGSIISLFYIIKIVSKRMNYIPIIFISTIYGSIVLSTILTHGNYQKFLLISLCGVGVCSLILDSFSSDKTCLHAIDSLIFILETYLVLNLCVMVLFPNGIYTIYSFTMKYSNPAYLLGHRNNVVEYFLPLIGLVGLRDKLTNNKMSRNFYFVLFISAISSIITWSVNEMLCMAFIIVSLALFSRKGIKIYSIKLFLLIAAIASFALITIELNPLVQNIIVNIFKKSATMSGRTRIWANALLSIFESPVIGHGVHDAEYNFLRLGHISSCHNYFLDFLYLGGIVNLAAVVFFLLYLDKRLSNISIGARTLVNIIFGAYFILWLATPIHKENIYLMFMYFIASISLVNKFERMNLPIPK